MSSKLESKHAQAKPLLSSFPPRSDEWYKDVLSKALGYEIRDYQLNGIQSLCEGKDLFAIAPTGAGKSTFVTGPALADFAATGKMPITITVVPTKSLADDQANAVNALKSQYLKALALHQDSLAESRARRKIGEDNQDLFKEIEIGKYTHVYLSPEMVTNPRFDQLLRSKGFLALFRYFGIDEVHLVTDWVQFRPKFDDIKRLRSRFPPSIVWFALSATVEPTREFPMLQKALGFSSTKTHIIRLPVDRRNIVLAPRFLQHPAATQAKDFLDLSWIIPPSATRPEDIPITIVFVDELQQACDVAGYLSRLLPLSIPANIRGQMVQQITGFLTTNTEVIEDVRLDKSTRIIVSTSAGSVGLDIAQIQQVVVIFSRKSTTYKEVFQKFGRIRNVGLAVILFPRWMDIKRTSASDIKQRAEVEPIMVDFANAPIDRCPRRVNTDYWQETYHPYDAKLGPCCNRHNPEVETEHLQVVEARAKETKARIKEKNQAKKPGFRSDGTYPVPDPAVMQPLAMDQINYWRHINISRIQGYQPHMPASLLLPDNSVSWLARYMHLCTTMEHFREVMRDWSELDKWGESLFDWVCQIWATFELQDVKEMIEEAQQARKSTRFNPNTQEDTAAAPEGLGAVDAPNNHVTEDPLPTTRDPSIRGDLSKQKGNRSRTKAVSATRGRKRK